METSSNDRLNEMLNENVEIDKLSLDLAFCEGINVWSSKQEHLEQQALQELEIFVEESKKTTLELEDGEIVSDSETNSEAKQDAPALSLDVNGYIKRQEEFRRQRLLKVQSIENAAVISEHTKKANKRKYIDPNAGTVQQKKQKIYEQCASTSKDCFEEDEEHCSEVGDEAVKESESSESEYVPSEGDLEEDSDYEPSKLINIKSNDREEKKKKNLKKHPKETFRVRDDGLLKNYKTRLQEYYKRLEAEQESLRLTKEGESEYDILEDEKEYHELKAGLKVPIKLWDNLYGYQKDGIKWLWELHRSPSGGILGDEMGLGKTVQIIVFLHSLQYSRIVSSHCRFTGVGPSIIVCPATVIHQWVKHFHDWCPEFRVAVLHQSGSYQGYKANLIKEMHKDKGIIITTYLGILKFKGNLLEHTWHYFILDEGHKIRNPSAKVSVAVKQLRTPHRLLLTGSPMQNNLAELWSLFDFTNPGMLGNLQTFQEHFAMPILQGGFANASPMQEAVALSVASTLKNIITPYLLRRMKSEVNHHLCLPNKSEQVLFCSLTDEQTRLYKDFLMSEQVNSILGRGIKNWFADKFTRGNVLVSIMTLRKICNHPDLYLHGADSNSDEEDYGFYKKSGKMIVVAALLKIWKKQGHRVLLFTQGRMMILLFQDFLEQQGYKYLKMDGSTGVGSRQPLIEKFNNDSSYDVFLLTTRVGGLGINLTGANRVIIYDPDWNPATDTQARERAWRIGQNKQVTIYRLLSAGTIEEKMYQRQVWKQLLSNKVLIDPSTNKFFKSSDLHDLFSLQESSYSNPESANIFYDSRVKMQNIYKEKQSKKKKHINVKNTDDDNSLQFSEDKIQEMKNLAQQISRSLLQTKPKEPDKKTAYQKELEEQRQKKLKEKEKLKQLTAHELIEYNKIKAMMKEDEHINRLDSTEANISFEKALEYSEAKSKLYHNLKHSNKSSHKAVIEQQDSSRDKETSGLNDVKLKHKKKKYGQKSKKKVVVDTSGIIDGKQVDGLVKSETKLTKDLDNTKSEQTQDNFVLEYLFTKRGVSDALQHDSIIESKCKGHGLRVNFEAKQRAEKALEALKKSRLHRWSW